MSFIWSNFLKTVLWINAIFSIFLSDPYHLITRIRFTLIGNCHFPWRLAEICFVLRFLQPIQPNGSCRAWSVYFTTLLLGRLRPPSGEPVLCTFFRQKLISPSWISGREGMTVENISWSNISTKECCRYGGESNLQPSDKTGEHKAKGFQNGKHTSKVSGALNTAVAPLELSVALKTFQKVSGCS